jgi:hypothetical protein
LSGTQFCGEGRSVHDQPGRWFHEGRSEEKRRVVSKTQMDQRQWTGNNAMKCATEIDGPLSICEVFQRNLIIQKAVTFNPPQKSLPWPWFLCSVPTCFTSEAKSGIFTSDGRCRRYSRPPWHFSDSQVISADCDEAKSFIFHWTGRASSTRTRNPFPDITNLSTHHWCARVMDLTGQSTLSLGLV